MHLSISHSTLSTAEENLFNPDTTAHHGLLTSHYKFAQNSALHLGSSTTRLIIKSHL